ncbi:receptor-like protein 7 [Solanum verrucosum]|uniref:receptor-like protein 7 n=1 Tax=Solanum verrucosum TaxID=315347 RepID=UPI0020D0E3DC|nr:receptor-like protein 7 [Solanum verrucosum]
MVDRFNHKCGEIYSQGYVYIFDFKSTVFLNLAKENPLCRAAKRRIQVLKFISENEKRDCCEWNGVTCNGFTGHVIGLDLSSSCLSGTIHANNSLTKLVHLQRLNLAFNELNGFPLGNSISELTSLTHLNLLDSGFLKGKMIPPGLSKLSKLISLDLTWNFIQVGQTTLRSFLHNLTNLEVLLFRNVHAPFELPNNFPSSLRKLSLEGTDMFGNITDSQLFHLPNLQVLRLGWNPLITGTLLNFNWSFSKSILELDFSHTGIFGKVPDSIGNLHSLCYLDLSSNSLSGSIPESFGNLTAVTELTLTGNSFTGLIPKSIGNLTAITQLKLSTNSFTGTVPSSIRKLNKLHSLSLSLNNFEGPIPDIFANFSELDTLDFKRNNFTGPFPYSIATLTRLASLELQNNSLTGPLPSNISGLQELYNLDLSFNYFTGTTPPWLFLLPSLLNLYVQHNQFTGLPNELKRSSSDFTDVNLSYNQLLCKTRMEFNGFVVA